MPWKQCMIYVEFAPWQPVSWHSRVYPNLWSTGGWEQLHRGWGRQNKKQCLSRPWKTLLDSMGAKTMGTGLHPQGLKEIQVGLPWSGNMHSTRLQPCTQGFGLTSVETNSELAQLRLWAWVFSHMHMSGFPKAFPALTFTTSFQKGVSVSVCVLLHIWFPRHLEVRGL